MYALYILAVFAGLLAAFSVGRHDDVPDAMTAALVSQLQAEHALALAEADGGEAGNVAVTLPAEFVDGGQWRSAVWPARIGDSRILVSWSETDHGAGLHGAMAAYDTRNGQQAFLVRNGRAGGVWLPDELGGIPEGRPVMITELRR